MILKKSALMLLSFITFTAIASENLTLRQKIAQMMVVAVTPKPPIGTPEIDRQQCAAFIKSQPYNLDPAYVADLIETEQIGGVIFLGPHWLESMIDSRNNLQEKSKKPLFFFLDSEWGLSMRIKDHVVTYPKAMTLGALSDKDDIMIRELGSMIGSQLQSLGIHSPLAPVCDVNNNPQNPIINMRSFGENPDKVAKKAVFFMRGIEQANLLACAKHYPGHGDTDKDTHHTFASISHDMTRLQDVELKPFNALAKNKVSMVMTAHLDVPALTQEPGVPATFSKKATDYLRNNLGFKGLITTDGLGMVGAKIDSHAHVIVRAIKAGSDILLCPVDVKTALDAVEDAVHNDQISEQEIDEHLARITRAKNRVCSPGKIELDYHKLVNYPAIELKQRLYKAAITLARNNNKKLPLAKRTNALPLLTIGTDKENAFAQELRENGMNIDQTVLDNSLPDDEASNPLSFFGRLKCEHDIIVALHSASRSGMIEMGSDTNNQMQQYIEQINSLGNKVILVLFGNPYNLKDLPHSGATIVAYEDEPEAQIAAAQTLLGYHNPIGILPVTGSEDYPIGTGFSYEN